MSFMLQNPLNNAIKYYVDLRTASDEEIKTNYKYNSRVARPYSHKISLKLLS